MTALKAPYDTCGRAEPLDNNMLMLQSTSRGQINNTSTEKASGRQAQLKSILSLDGMPVLMEQGLRSSLERKPTCPAYFPTAQVAALALPAKRLRSSRANRMA